MLVYMMIIEDCNLIIVKKVHVGFWFTCARPPGTPLLSSSPVSFTLSFTAHAYLSIGHHVAHAAEVFGRQRLLELLTRQPLEIRIAEGITLQVSLASHDAALEEEGLESLLGHSAILANDGVLNDVSNGDTPNDPSVHVDTGSLVESTFSGLGS